MKKLSEMAHKYKFNIAFCQMKDRMFFQTERGKLGVHTFMAREGEEFDELLERTKSFLRGYYETYEEFNNEEEPDVCNEEEDDDL